MVNRRLGSHYQTGPASRVLHRSIIERFITKQALPADDAAKAKLDAAQIANLTLADLMNDKELGPLVLGSFALVKSDATLADAKNAMHNVSAALVCAGNCYDVFVTDRLRKRLKPTNDSWRVDETYVRVKGKWVYLYRAVDSTGATIDFLLSAKRDVAAAERFLAKALGGENHPAPRVINPTSTLLIRRPSPSSKLTVF